MNRKLWTIAGLGLLFLLALPTAGCDAPDGEAPEKPLFEVGDVAILRVEFTYPPPSNANPYTSYRLVARIRGTKAQEVTCTFPNTADCQYVEHFDGGGRDIHAGYIQTRHYMSLYPAQAVNTDPDNGFSMLPASEDGQFQTQIPAVWDVNPGYLAGHSIQGALVNSEPLKATAWSVEALPAGVLVTIDGQSMLFEP